MAKCKRCNQEDLKWDQENHDKIVGIHVFLEPKCASGRLWAGLDPRPSSKESSETLERVV